MRLKSKGQVTIRLPFGIGMASRRVINAIVYAEVSVGFDRIEPGG